MLRKSPSEDEIQNANVVGSDSDSGSDSEFLNFLENLDEEQVEEFINTVSLLKSAGFFATSALAVGEVSKSHFTDVENALHNLVGEISAMSNQPDFTEVDEHYLTKLKEVDALLTEHPEAINSYDSNFKVTPMHISAGSGLVELTKTLLKFNPDLNLKNCFGETPSERARGYARNDDLADLIDQAAQVKKPSC